MPKTRAMAAGRIGLVAASLLLLATPALGQITSQPADPPPQQHERAKTGPWSASAGIGFTLDPGTFLMTMDALYTDEESGFSAGPLLQIGLSDNNKIVAPTVNVRYSFDLSDAKNEIARDLSPFVQGGLGFAYIDKDRSAPKSDADGTGFLMNMGLGLEYALTERISLGNSILFNVLPDKTARQNFFFSWQFATMRFHF